MTDMNASTNMSALKIGSICTKNWFHTNAEKFEHEFTWVIEDFPLHVANIRQNRLKSPVFSAANDSCEWFLDLSLQFIRGSTTSHQQVAALQEWLHLTLSRSPNTINFGPTSGILMVSIMNSKHQKCNDHQQAFYVGNQNEKINSLKFIKSSDLKNELLPEGELRIYLKITFIRNIVTVSNHSPLQLNESNLTHDLEKLLNDEDSSDVVFDVDGKKYPAHRTILAARSPVFKAMFKHDMMESRQRCVEIKGIDEKIFQEVLRYIYTGMVENLNDLALELMVVAEKYDLQPLKNACLNALSTLLSEKTVVKVLIFADLNGAQCLKTQAIEYIRAHLLNVMKSEDWNSLNSNPDLMKCVLDLDG